MNMFQYAKRIEREQKTTPKILLDAAEEAMPQVEYRRSFLCAAVAEGLYLYVAKTLSSDHQRVRMEKRNNRFSLLHEALNVRERNESYPTHPPSYDMVKLLLDYGASPNATSGEVGTSPWLAFMSRALNHTRDGQERWGRQAGLDYSEAKRLAALLVSKGADVEDSEKGRSAVYELFNPQDAEYILSQAPSALDQRFESMLGF